MSIITEALKKAELEKKGKGSQDQSVLSRVPSNNLSGDNSEDTASLSEEQDFHAEPVLVEPIGEFDSNKKASKFSYILFGGLLIALVGLCFFIFQYYVQPILKEKYKESYISVVTGPKIETGSKSAVVPVSPRPVVITPVEKKPVVLPQEASASRRVESKFKVTGIIDEAGNEAAMIGDEILEMGEELDGFVLVGVNSKGIQLREKSSGKVFNIKI